MKTFEDAVGRSWSISLTLGSAMAVRDRLGVDLLQPEVGIHCVEAGNGQSGRRWQMDDSTQGGFRSPKGTPLLTRLGTDELFLGEVLCVLLEDQFDSHGLTEKDVRLAFDGKTLLAAQDAFYAELIDFFQSRGRTDRSTAAAKQHITIQKATVAAAVRIEQIDLDKLIAETLDEAMTQMKSGETSGTSPEPSASIPGA